MPLLLLAAVLHPVSYSYVSQLRDQSSSLMLEQSFMCSIAVLYYKKFIGDGAQRVSNVMQQMWKYVKGETVNRLYMANCSSPFDYWEMSRSVVGEELYLLSSFILSIVCQSATCERLFSRFGFFQTNLRNRLKSEKLHALQEVKRSVCEKDQVEQQRTSKVVKSIELPKSAKNDGAEQSLDDGVELLDGEALSDSVNNVNASEFSYAQVMENWLNGLSLGTGSGDDDATNEENSIDDDNDKTNLLALNRDIEEMKFDDGKAYRAANPLPQVNNSEYPQERLTGFRAKKMRLQQLFDNLIELPPSLLKYGS